MTWGEIKSQLLNKLSHPGTPIMFLIVWVKIIIGNSHISLLHILIFTVSLWAMFLIIMFLIVWVKIIIANSHISLLHILIFTVSLWAMHNYHPHFTDEETLTKPNHFAQCHLLLTGRSGIRIWLLLFQYMLLTTMLHHLSIMTTYPCIIKRLWKVNEFPRKNPLLIF